MNKLTVVINTLNEEKNLPRVLESVKNLADEIVVVDMHSEDETVEIAKKYGALVFSYPRTNYVEPARNFAIDKARGEWILIVDADEEIPATLAKKITEVISSEKSVEYYRLPRKNIIWKKWIKHSRWWPDLNVRLFKKGRVVWKKEIHSVPITQGVGENFPENEETAIIHHNYPTVEVFVDRLNRYTTEEAKNLIADGYKFKWQDLVKKPSEEFLSRYFFGQGYQDGVHGLALAFLQSFYQTVKYLKVWQSQGFDKNNLELKEVVKELNQAQKELNYWQADAQVREKGGLFLRIKRKFKLL